MTVNILYEVEPHKTIANAIAGEMKVFWSDPERLMRDFPNQVKEALKRMLLTEGIEL
jgi:hypothetical protein